jgi:UDP-GlcNAc:undecaprenyl-phosphate/decaprenyl-phosphate GlcNAc-1-phosphate transferase
VTGVWWEYLAIFSATATVCVVLTPWAMRLAFRRNLLDHPGGHKSHDTAVPYLGGVSIVATFSLMVVLISLIWPPHSGLRELLVVLAMAVFLALVGLADDVRQVSPLWRIVAEIVAAVAIWSVGTGAIVTASEPVNMGLTILWFVGITNAFNLLDNMDGLAAGLAAIASLTIFAIATTNGQFLVAGLSVGLTGCTVGFLRHNFHPARIYMGDGGSLFIGFLVAYLGIKLRFQGERLLSALVPMLVCSVAIFDTSLVTISRLATRRSPFQGGQDHVSHRLVRLGLPVPVAVGTIYLGAIGIGILTYVVSGVDPKAAWVLAGMIVGTLIVGGGFLLTITVYPEGSGSGTSIAENYLNDQADSEHQ